MNCNLQNREADVYQPQQVNRRWVYVSIKIDYLMLLEICSPLLNRVSRRSDGAIYQAEVF